MSRPHTIDCSGEYQTGPLPPWRMRLLLAGRWNKHGHQRQARLSMHLLVYGSRFDRHCFGAAWQDFDLDEVTCLFLRLRLLVWGINE